MNRVQVTELLRLLTNVWPNLAISDDVITAWHFVFMDEDPVEVLSYVRAALKTGKYVSEFCPTPQKICHDMHRARLPSETPVIVFRAGPRAAQTERAKQAWHIWGGLTKWQTLPDLRYAQDGERALATWRFEEEKFCSIYSSLEEEERQRQLRITQSHAKNLLAHVKRQGIDFTRLLERK